MEALKNLSQSMEDYLRAIYKFEEKGKPATTSALAEQLGVAPASVTKMLKRLASMDLVEHEPYRGVTLTSLGEKTSLGLVRQHRLIELFLVEILKVPWDRVHEEAHRLEHVLSDYLEERMSDILGNPLFDPHGQPIPTRDGEILRSRVQRLSKTSTGYKGKIAQIEDDDAELLRYVAELGLFPQSPIEVLKHRPYGGGMEVRVDGEVRVIGPQAVPHIWLYREEGDDAEDERTESKKKTVKKATKRQKRKKSTEK